MKKLGVSNSSVVKDNQLTASSYLYEEKNAIYHFKPYYARLHTHGGGGAWCSSNTDEGQYIQVDFLRNLRVTYIQTQGRYRGAEFVETYRIRYQRSGDTEWRRLYSASGKENVSFNPYLLFSIAVCVLCMTLLPWKDGIPGISIAFCPLKLNSFSSRPSDIGMLNS